MENQTIISNPPLPDLQQTVLDPATFEQLFRDIAACAEVTDVIPKFSAEGYVPDGASIGIDEGCAMLLRGDLRGLQLRYRYQGEDWWDTLIKTPNGIRLVRIRQEF